MTAEWGHYEVWESILTAFQQSTLGRVTYRSQKLVFSLAYNSNYSTEPSTL